MKISIQHFTLTFLLGIAICLSSCSHYSPKPHGYPKINYPEKAYVSFDTNCPYSFEVPVYAEMQQDRDENTENCWYNLYFPGFKGTLHLSYKEFDDIEVLYKMTEDAYKLAMKHAVKAEAIAEIEKTDTVSGNSVMIYELEGKTASPYNFYVTDNKRHFIRGAFYFDDDTDKDSVAPVFDFIKKDIEHLIYSTRFK